MLKAAAAVICEAVFHTLLIFLVRLLCRCSGNLSLVVLEIHISPVQSSLAKSPCNAVAAAFSGMQMQISVDTSPPHLGLLSGCASVFLIQSVR